MIIEQGGTLNIGRPRGPGKRKENRIQNNLQKSLFLKSLQLFCSLHRLMHLLHLKDPSGANSPETGNEVLHEKKIEEVIESNTDSNKSNNMFQTPSNMYSSNSSMKNDFDYMTPKSRHNLNLLFESNVKRSSQSQRRIINRE